MHTLLVSHNTGVQQAPASGQFNRSNPIRENAAERQELPHLSGAEKKCSILILEGAVEHLWHTGRLVCIARLAAQESTTVALELGTAHDAVRAEAGLELVGVQRHLLQHFKEAARCRETEHG